MSLLTGAIICLFCAVFIAVNAFQYHAYYMTTGVPVNAAGYLDYGNGDPFYIGTKSHFLRPILLSAIGLAYGLYLFASGLLEMRKSSAPEKKKWRLPGS